MKNSIFICFFVLMIMIILFQGNSWAFNDSVTHPELAARAIKNSAMDTYLKEILKLDNGVKEKIDGRLIEDRIKYGAQQEDHPMCRASNHFHNPSLPWNESGLSDPFFPYIVYCSLFSSYSHNGMISDLTWATGYSDNPDAPNTDITKKNEQDWDSAREYFYIYLTGKDFNGKEAATDDTSRKKKLGECMHALGQVLHLLQDMAVPAHVRNDFSQGHQMLVPEYPLLGNRFESYLRNNNGQNWFNEKIEAPFSSPRLTDFWDTTYPEGIHLSGPLGLSEYTQINFLSENTMFTDDFPFPKKEHCKTYYDDSFSPPRKYFASTNGHPGEQINHLAMESYLYTYDEKYIPGDWQSWPPPEPALIYFALDDKCYYEYASHLIPRAIGYSANLIDYFFRSQLEITAVPSSQSFELKIKNMTPTREELSNGQFSLTVRYTPEWGNSDGSDDIFVTANDVESGVLQYDQEAEYHFDLVESIPEENLDSVQCILAFKGTLGNEVNAVIGKVQEVESKSPCLVIELDGEYVIWSLVNDGLLPLHDDIGSVVDYPIPAAEIDVYLRALNLEYVSGLSGSSISFAHPGFEEATAVELGCVTAPVDCIGSDSSITYCQLYGENVYGSTTISNILAFWMENDRCTDPYFITTITKGYSDSKIIELPGTEETFEATADYSSSSSKKTMYGNTFSATPWVQEKNLVCPVNIDAVSLSINAGVNQKSALFWFDLEMSQTQTYFFLNWSFDHIEWDTQSTVRYNYKSYINPSMNSKEAIFSINLNFWDKYGYMFSSGNWNFETSDLVVKAGTHRQFAVVLEQPIVTVKSRSISGYTGGYPPQPLYKWILEEHWEQSQLYIQTNGVLEDSNSDYVYDWSALKAINMDVIMSEFSKTLDEDVAENGVNGGLTINIYE